MVERSVDGLFGTREFRRRCSETADAASTRTADAAYSSPVKILRLTTSNDTVHQGPGSRVDWLQRLGTEQLGEPLELVTRPIWPDMRLPAAVERWCAQENPDVVWLVLQSFWFEYLSVPKKLERRFGRAGKVASEAGFRAADKAWLSHNPVFRTGRRLVQKAVGGDPHFTPGEIIAAVEGVARVVLRSEGRQFVVWGPFSYQNFGETHGQERRQLHWRSQVVTSVRALSEELHFPAEAPEKPYWQTQPPITMHRDQFHFAAAEQRTLAQREIDFLWNVVLGPHSAQ